MLSIGKLSHRVEIQSDQPTEQDAHGQPVERWTTEAIVWAQLMPQNGSESQRGDQVTATGTHQVRIRYRRSMNAGKRLKYGERLFDVNFVQDVDEANREMILTCTELPSVSV